MINTCEFSATQYELHPIEELQLVIWKTQLNNRRAQLSCWKTQMFNPKERQKSNNVVEITLEITLRVAY